VEELNNGTSLLYSPPFGDLVDEEAVPAVGLLAELQRANHLNCGIMVSTNSIGNITIATMVEGVGVIMCRTMAAAILNGNYKRVTLFPFEESDKDSAYAALMNGTIGKSSRFVGGTFPDFVSHCVGTIDILANAKAEFEYDFAGNSLEEGFQFSAPYYYGDEPVHEDLSIYTLATREQDAQFSSFVSLVVLATIQAEQDGILRVNSKSMPIISAYGSDVSWALRDAISYR